MNQINTLIHSALLCADDLTDYMDGFFGYGNLRAPVWFVGMEEGGGGSIDEIGRRLAAWRQRGRPVLDDLAQFHRAFGEGKLFTEGARVQRTWKELMRIALMVDGREAGKEAMQAYQIDGFGSIDGPVALLELLPLPKPSISAWPYAQWTCSQTMPHLQKRKLYQDHILQRRISEIRCLVDRYRPRALVFYGKSYEQHWESIARQKFEGEAYPSTAKSGRTTYLLLPHPTARGGSQTPHYTRAGLLLREILGQAQPIDSREYEPPRT